jgi:hypothetical protein
MGHKIPENVVDLQTTDIHGKRLMLVRPHFQLKPFRWAPRSHLSYLAVLSFNLSV